MLQYRLQLVENAVMELRTAHKSIAESLQQLVRLEERHAETQEGLRRAWKRIEEQAVFLRDLDGQIPAKLVDRLQAIEQDMPMMRRTSGWVLAMLVACAAAAGWFVWKRVTDPVIVPAMERRPSPHASRPVDN